MVLVKGSEQTVMVFDFAVIQRNYSETPVGGHTLFYALEPIVAEVVVVKAESTQALVVPEKSQQIRQPLRLHVGVAQIQLAYL